jgi:hypothetical protein
MRRSSIISAATITSLTAALSAFALTSSGAATSETVTVHVQAIGGLATYVPVQQLVGSKSQTNQGDYLTFNEPVVKPGTRTTVGHVLGICYLTAPRAGLFYCTANWLLHGHGQVAGQGMYDATGRTTTTDVVTGGTGEYVSAHGTFRTHAINANRTDFVFTFTP